MNKKDIAAIRRQFKLDNDLLKINDIFNVYIPKESSDIYHQESQPFAMLDREQQELFMTNFKKVLTGKLDVKLFEVKFKRDTEENSQLILHESLKTKDVEEWKAHMLRIVEKMVNDDVQYEKDMVVTFIRGEYFNSTKRFSEESEINDRDEVYTNPFILCSLNRTEEPKKSLVFDYIEREFRSNIMVDPIINLTSPVGGFLFPSITDDAADVNRVLYATGKANQPDFHFIENVLSGEDIITAQEDKAVFEEIVKDVVGDEVDTHTLANVYEEINRMIDEEEEEEESPTLNYREVERVLKVSGVEDVETEKVEEAFQKIIDDEKYELKASNIVPNYTAKSIKIETPVAKVSISPEGLKYIKRVNYNGKRCLLIEVEEDTMIEGFKLIPQAELR
ncbi:DUF4317 domain-containing protein [Pseudogracilibacillus auburnensis]|uniref:Uncharacterized protein DUF4317 n=1 Tax=Pseudogracilibacillus auburnensis TaxID=1494959 RepID=A0A2V3VSE8_9BACI|nr:DUF4317 domain-containing protein [Pseudogracilibacillus auburnensis]MBO1003895.1 DUF4317 domain-containing protein [Pseudogracilibacillus auburnensis]PXW84822.1 uncharacterized protein DUF4317 [Pseudogracilibacillus auburnensis]